MLNIAMNRPKVLNAQNPQMWEETKGVFDAASTDPECRCVLLTGNGRLFTAGIDLQQSFVSNDVQQGEGGGGADAAAAAAAEESETPDVARRALAQVRGIMATQALFNAIEECRVPVVAAIHRACLGAGVDMVCAADIRYCTADSTFAIKEVMLGLAADVGTLQRMPKVMGSESLLRELAFTGRDFTVRKHTKHTSPLSCFSMFFLATMTNAGICQDRLVTHTHHNNLFFSCVLCCAGGGGEGAWFCIAGI